MYIADTTPRGLHHLVYEVVDNSIDEAMAGYASEVSVTINNDGSVTVEDDGRGIPVEEHPDLGFSTLQGVMTVLKFGGKFRKGAYQTSGGLHGVGVTVVNFLSEWCEVEVRRDGHVYQQEYERGVPVAEVRRIGTQRPGAAPRPPSSPTRRSSPTPSSSYSILYRRLQELAFLNRGVKIILPRRADRRRRDLPVRAGHPGVRRVPEPGQRARPPGHHLHRRRVRRRRPGSGHAVLERVHRERPLLRQQHLHHRGRHARFGLPRRHRPARSTPTARRSNLFKDLIAQRRRLPRGADGRHLAPRARAAVRGPDQDQAGQQRDRGDRQLGRGRFPGHVTSRRIPKTAKIIVQKGLLAAEAREVGPQGPATGPRAQGALWAAAACPASSATAPAARWTTASCTWSRAIRPAAAPKGGRIREYQAILPLRGKIINAYKSRDDKVLANEEVRSMISAIGAGIGEEMDLAKRRYSKVIIMTDADVDGSHIRTLLLTFFYRQMYDAGQGRLRLRRPAAAVPRAAQEGDLLRPDRRGDEDPTARGRPGRRGLRAGRRPDDRGPGDGAALPHAGRAGGFAAGPGAPRHQPPRPRRPPGPGHRPAARVPRLPRPAGAMVHHARTARRVPRRSRSRQVGEELEAGRRRRRRDDGSETRRPRGCTSSSCTKSARSTTNWPSCARWASRSTA